MVKVNGFIGAPVNDCGQLKVIGHSNCDEISLAVIDPKQVCDPIFTRSLNEFEVGVGAKIKGTRSLRESQIWTHSGSKVMQKVSAFGPAHAEQARKLYQVKRSQQEDTLNCFEEPESTDVHSGRHVWLSKNEKAQVSTNGFHLPEEPIHYEQRVIYRKCGEKKGPLPEIFEPNQPILKIVKITPRPNRDCASPKTSSDVGQIGNPSDRFVKEEPLTIEDKILRKGPCITTLQILGEISSAVYLRQSYSPFVRIL